MGGSMHKNRVFNGISDLFPIIQNHVSCCTCPWHASITAYRTIALPTMVFAWFRFCLFPIRIAKPYWRGFDACCFSLTLANTFCFCLVPYCTDSWPILSRCWPYYRFRHDFSACFTLVPIVPNRLRHTLSPCGFCGLLNFVLRLSGRMRFLSRFTVSACKLSLALRMRIALWWAAGWVVARLPVQPHWRVSYFIIRYFYIEFLVSVVVLFLTACCLALGMCVDALRMVMACLFDYWLTSL